MQKSTSWLVFIFLCTGPSSIHLSTSTECQLQAPSLWRGGGGQIPRHADRWLWPGPNPGLWEPLPGMDLLQGLAWATAATHCLSPAQPMHVFFRASYTHGPTCPGLWPQPSPFSREVPGAGTAQVTPSCPVWHGGMAGCQALPWALQGNPHSLGLRELLPSHVWYVQSKQKTLFHTNLLDAFKTVLMFLTHLLYYIFL